jgi:hypothetical protein
MTPDFTYYVSLIQTNLLQNSNSLALLASHQTRNDQQVATYSAFNNQY